MKLFFPSRPGPEHCYWIEDFKSTFCFSMFFLFKHLFSEAEVYERFALSKIFPFLVSSIHFCSALITTCLLQDFCSPNGQQWSPMVTLLSGRSSCGRSMWWHYEAHSPLAIHDLLPTSNEVFLAKQFSRSIHSA